MGLKFRPVLIETISNSPVYWEDVRLMIEGEILQLLEREDIQRLRDEIVKRLGYTPRDIESKLQDIIFNFKYGEGPVSFFNPSIQHIFLALLG